MDSQNVSNVTILGDPWSGLQKRMMWPRFLMHPGYALGWFFAAAGVAQVGVAIGVGIWKAVRSRRTAALAEQEGYGRLAIDPDVCIARLGDQNSGIATAA
mmetsp:Transcript_9823/g.25228  ORF Transcript_9823/g.25228 Transcript_9823/m.25228 type:complete len:100 (-) Transcript_9823:1129-1428(-)